MKIDGPEEIMSKAGGNEAWRIRSSTGATTQRSGSSRYTIVRDGYSYLFTYSTEGPWEESADVFAPLGPLEFESSSTPEPDPSKDAGLHAVR